MTARRPLALLAVAVSVVRLLSCAGPAAAAPADGSDTVLTGSLYGSDGRAVSALIGVDLKDARGRSLGASGCVRSSSCPVDGYALTRRVNFDLDGQGSADTARYDTGWSVTLPAEAASVYVDVFPQGRRYAGTDTSRYAASFRRNVPVGTGRTLNLRLPLVCGVSDEADRPGQVYGYGVDAAGRRVALRRVTAYSMEADNNGPTPVLGFGVGVIEANGSFRVRHLATGGSNAADHDGQRYQLIATAEDGRVSRAYNVPVTDCHGTRRDLTF